MQLFPSHRLMSFISSLNDRKKPTVAETSRAERAARLLAQKLKEQHEKEVAAAIIICRFICVTVDRQRATLQLRLDWDRISSKPWLIYNKKHSASPVGSGLILHETGASGISESATIDSLAQPIVPTPTQLLALATLLVKFYSPAKDGKKLEQLSQWLLPQSAHAQSSILQVFARQSLHPVSQKSVICNVLRLALDRACGETDSVTDLEEKRFYMTGPEMRLLLYFTNPKNMNQHVDLANLICNSLLQCGMFKMIGKAMHIRLLPLIIANKSLCQSHSSENRQLHLWINAALQISMQLCRSHQVDVQSLSFSKFIIFVMTCPLLVDHINAQALQILSIDSLVSMIFKTFRSADMSISILSLIEGDDALFLVGNLVRLFMRSDSAARQLEDSLPRPKTVIKPHISLIQVNYVNLVDILIVLLQHCCKFIEHAASGNVMYHPIFMWYTGSCKQHQHVVYNLVIDQLSILWSAKVIQKLFESTLAIESVSSLSTSEITHISVSLCSICQLYIDLANTLSTQALVIWNKLSYTPHLIHKMLGVVETLGPKRRGFSLFVSAAETRAFELEPYLAILHVFCQMTMISFVTLREEDIYVKQYPFSLDRLHEFAVFLNTLCFNLYWYGHSRPKVSAQLVQIRNICKSLLGTIMDMNSRRPLQGQPSKTTWVIKRCAKPDFLNQIQQGDPQAMSILSNTPQCIPFENRVQLFRNFIRIDRSQYCDESRGISIKVFRQRLLEDGFSQLRKFTCSQLKQTVRVKFVDQFGSEEIGIDQNGIFKEFMEDICKQAFSTEFGLFKTTLDGNVTPFLNSVVHDEHLQLFEFIGRMMGKALYEGIVIDIPFALYIYAKLLGRYNYMDDLPSLDPELYRSLTFIKDYEGDCSDLGLDFTISQDIFGHVTNVEIKPGGAHIPLTNDNVFEYIHLMADFRLNQECKDQFQAFICGFRSIIQDQWLHIFSPMELQWLMSGENSKLDIKDLRMHTRYEGGYFDLHRTIRNFWAVLGEFTPKDQSAFLKYVTSCSKSPVGGFQHLDPPFTICFLDAGPDTATSSFTAIGNFLGLGKDKDRLPTARTCFNLLKLPSYSKKSTLYKKLLYAIQYGAGFDLS
ncbi:hypothetical protein BDV3_000342 [Batrachochytrium dendrobatidis]|uniref:HECT-type E3 ubiquitin transferase n=1 Tax=Batrachochytrium dendrobatidis (strain JEL423) TaxID=403673 RepID=A0A177WBC4_BATDL|nr:hypothetical protein BDEG_21367 [Batrachochytrium dendrobatidis JEL423]